MDIVLSIAAFVLSIIGIIGCVLPIIPGTILSYAGLLCTFFCSYSTMPQSVVWIMLAVSLVVSVIDYFLPAYMTKLFGGSRAGAIGATIGVVAGLFMGGPVGVIIGPFAGAVLGEMIHDRNDVGKAFRIGVGSFISFVAGTGIKLAAGVAMFVYVWKDTYPVVKDWMTTIF